MTLVAGCLYLLYYRGVIRSEENRLVDLFGPDFEAYRQTTPRFWPAFRHYHLIQLERTISTRIVERGLREVVWFFAMILFIDQLENLHLAGHFVVAVLPL
ncbi:MAG: hypothetical protein GVY36_12590 [Verrucomicrobia bacterium]|jgi:hypothetical protein|nr:hypothetical protein [Verrucomicrobiota bacterium]